MKFCKKLEIALKENGLNATELSKRIGVSKATMSNWVNGKTIPSEKYMKVLEEHLEFKEEEKENSIGITPQEVATILGKSLQFIYLGLQRGIFPWGYAVLMDSGKWSYFINKKRFFDIEMIEES